MIYTDKEYWNKYWEKEMRSGYNFYFVELLDQYIPWNKINSYMEIGGAPGNIMAYMHNVHGINVATIDFTDKTRLQSCLESHSVNDAIIINEDFETINVREYGKAFDIVASWGFLEHFEKSVTAEFITKKKDMVSDSGYLIIELPNIRKLFWLSYWLFNRDLLRIHNLKIMELNWLKKQVQKGRDFEILFASYYFTMNRYNEYFITHPRISNICQGIVRHFQRRKISDRVKKWFYPYIVIIARRKS